ncbi:hypothetical protein [uncultured Friedmanniella sp.]|uniref:hypothetical protein n=1 Tax=uncultured Friedmanniella sp. TaxID=335381 RepID=UPI0035CB1C8E
MTSPLVHSSHRPLRIALDVVLRAGGLVAAVAALTALADGTDALADGLDVFFKLCVLAFALALLDGLFQRDRLRLYLVWAFVVPLVGLFETADYLRSNLTGPGAYPNLAAIGLSDVAETYVLYAALVGAPAAVGVLLGVLLRPLPATPAPTVATSSPKVWP